MVESSELWFAEVERDVIARGVFTSVPDVARKLRRYINAYFANCRTEDGSKLEGEPSADSGPEWSVPETESAPFKTFREAFRPKQ